MERERKRETEREGDLRREGERESKGERKTEKERERGNNYCACAAAPTSANSPTHPTLAKRITITALYREIPLTTFAALII